jgi:pyruvate,orthophosphate dikinase
VLTDTVFCLSRENGGWLLPPHLTESLSPDHSSTALDMEGVGALIRLAVERARSARADIEIRVCGRHGQDPAAIPLYDDLLINAVVCHPSQLLGARLMVGQAAVRERVARRRA